jgi:Holliday junction resolvase RusA-like endonuclease
MFTAAFDLAAVPLARPRVTKRGTFLPKRSQQFRADFQTLARAAFRGKPFNSNIAVTLHFFKPINPSSRNFGDIDNLVKAVLDAGNGLLWTDDSLITAIHAFKHKGKGKIILEVTENVE